MLAFLAGILAASTQVATQEPVLEPAMPWWERISVTFDDKGAQQSCKYQSSLSPNGAEDCDDGMAANLKSRGGKAQTGVYSKLTFERRFSPVTPDSGRLQPGDQLLGRQVMYLTINSEGSIESCKVVSTSGDMPPEYDCEEVKSEQFRAAASASASPPRQAFMTILAYGHKEQIA